MTRDRSGEVTELLRQLIRNRCVNDGTPKSGQESRNADLLRDYLEGCGVDMVRYEPVPGRASLVARMEGSDPDAPSLALMAHTDVVPVRDPGRWEHDPFGAELVDGVIWGRGAIDMLNLTSSMAVAVRRLAAGGFRPRGDLLFLAVADEEALGTHGAHWLVDNEWDAVRCDFLVTEFGGFRYPAVPGPPRLLLATMERGTAWCTVRVRGTPGHGSMPYRADNALVKAAELIRRLTQDDRGPTVHDGWRRFVAGLGLPEDAEQAMLDPPRLSELYRSVDRTLAASIYSCTHTTFAPTMVRGGLKHNVIPDEIEVALDVRTLPGHGQREVEAMIREAAGELADSIEIAFVAEENPSSSSAAETPLRDSIDRITRALVPDARTVPFIITGATDARFFRRRGVTAYGYGLYSERIPSGDFTAMFHGDNERVDQDSLALTTDLWDALVRDFLG